MFLPRQSVLLKQLWVRNLSHFSVPIRRHGPTSARAQSVLLKQVTAGPETIVQEPDCPAQSEFLLQDTDVSPLHMRQGQNNSGDWPPQDTFADSDVEPLVCERLIDKPVPEMLIPLAGKQSRL
jgi:hypothetical protein